MKKYWLAILSWIFLLIVLVITEAILFKVLLPFFINIASGFGISITKSLRYWTYWFVIFLVVIVYYLFFSKTLIGRKGLEWFLNINRKIFLKSK